MAREHRAINLQMMGIPTVFPQKELNTLWWQEGDIYPCLILLLWIVNSLLLLGALLNDRMRHDRLSWVMSLLWLGVFFCSAAKTHIESLYVQLSLITKLSGTLWWMSSLASVVPIWKQWSHWNSHLTLTLSHQFLTSCHETISLLALMYIHFLYAKCISEICTIYCRR